MDEANSNAAGLSRDEAISLLRKSIETIGQKEFEEPTKFTFTQSSHRKIVNLESRDESVDNEQLDQYKFTVDTTEKRFFSVESISPSPSRKPIIPIFGFGKRGGKLLSFAKHGFRWIGVLYDVGVGRKRIPAGLFGFFGLAQERSSLQ